MAKLLPIHQRFIVQRLACYDTPSAVRDAIKEEFGVDVTIQHVMHYDPDHGEPSAKWRSVYEATRKEFLASTAKIAIGQKSYRLRELGKLYQHVTTGKAKNVVLAADLLEQAAKESGDMFVNRKTLDVPPESEESRVQRMREQLAAMDEKTAPVVAPIPPGTPV